MNGFPENPTKPHLMEATSIASNLPSLHLRPYPWDPRQYCIYWPWRLRRLPAALYAEQSAAENSPSRIKLPNSQIYDNIWLCLASVFRGIVAFGNISADSAPQVAAKAAAAPLLRSPEASRLPTKTMTKWSCRFVPTDRIFHYLWGLCAQAEEYNDTYLYPKQTQRDNVERFRTVVDFYPSTPRDDTFTDRPGALPFFGSIHERSVQKTPISRPRTEHVVCCTKYSPRAFQTR